MTASDAICPSTVPACRAKGYLVRCIMLNPTGCCISKRAAVRQVRERGKGTGCNLLPLDNDAHQGYFLKCDSILRRCPSVCAFCKECAAWATGESGTICKRIQETAQHPVCWKTRKKGFAFIRVERRADSLRALPYKFLGALRPAIRKLDAAMAKCSDKPGQQAFRNKRFLAEMLRRQSPRKSCKL